VIRALARMERKEFAASVADFETSLRLASAEWPLREQVKEWLGKAKEGK